MEEYGYKNQESTDPNPEPVSMKEWLITLLIMCIPIVNLVMPFVWAFGGGSNPSKSNFFKAQLIVMAISIVVLLLFLSVLTPVLRESV